jgi:uncharacterized membrane protein
MELDDLIEHYVHAWHIHPMLVHLPITLFLGALGFEILSLIFKKEQFHHTAFNMYVAAALLSPVVAMTGLWERDELHLRHRLVDLHQTFGLITMWTALASLVIFWFVHKKNPQQFRKVFLVFALILTVTVSTAAYFGGTMVYDYAVGVTNS